MTNMMMRALGSALIASATMLSALLVCVQVTNGIDALRAGMRRHGAGTRRLGRSRDHAAAPIWEPDAATGEEDLLDSDGAEASFTVTRELVQAIDEEVLVCSPF